MGNSSDIDGGGIGVKRKKYNQSMLRGGKAKKN
jgi:hypothetical protein